MTVYSDGLILQWILWNQRKASVPSSTIYSNRLTSKTLSFSSKYNFSSPFPNQFHLPTLLLFSMPLSAGTVCV